MPKKMPRLVEISMHEPTRTRTRGLPSPGGTTLGKLLPMRLRDGY